MPDSNAVPAPKSLFASKTAFAQFLQLGGAAVAMFYPPAQEFLQAHAVAILTASAVGNLVLRTITHGRVYLFPDVSSNGL